MKWKRTSTYEKHLEDRFVNSFYKTGFINEDIFDRDSRDIWKAFIRLLSNSNTSAMYSTLLVAYREIPYSPELIQEISIQSNKKKKLKDYDATGEVRVDTKLDYFKIYECIFIKSPYMYHTNLKNRDCILNTMNILKNEFSENQGYTIVKSSLQAMNDAGHMASEDTPEHVNKNEDLFLRNSNNDISRTIMLVPMLIDDSYYMVDGIRTYPIISEAYHYSTSRFGQKEFICKNNNGGKYAQTYSIIIGYFDSAFLDNGDGPEIFYIKTSKKCFYNPLMFLNKFEAKDLYDDVMSEKSLGADIKKIFKNTYQHYLDNIDDVRDKYKNLIPSIKVWRRNDSFFDEELEKSFSDENFVVKKFNRRMIPKTMIKSLIMGFNNVRYYTFYGHMNDICIMSKHRMTNKVNYASDMVSEDTPKSIAIYAAIRSNKDLCANYDNTNPYDVWARVSYKKYINPTTRDIRDAEGGDVSKSPPRDYMRYMTEEEYTLIDPTTVKSENTSGIVSSFTLFNHKKEAFRKADEI